MDNLQIELMRQALREHGAIRPFARGKRFNDCFAWRRDTLVFRFQTFDGRSRAVAGVNCGAAPRVRWLGLRGAEHPNP